jgi:hypothetical protein
MSGHFILDGHDPKPAEFLEWALWFGANDRRVAWDKFDGVEVSTVFLGLDHRFGDGPPLIFETMIFGGQLDEETERYSTWDEAVAGHKKMVERVRESA